MYTNDGDFWAGATLGAIAGSLLIACWAIYLRDRGRDECDAKLPRSEQCVQVWVPEPAPKEPTHEQ